eukprot:1221553-Lingulodinium_polyedra.AAC.1
MPSVAGGGGTPTAGNLEVWLLQIAKTRRGPAPRRRLPGQQNHAQTHRQGRALLGGRCRRGQEAATAP